MTPSTAQETNDALVNRYAQIVQLEQLRALAGANPRLSGLFVGGVTEAYLASPRKVLLVGKETAGWNRGLARVREHDSVQAYLRSAIARHHKELAAPRPGSKFFQFYRQLTALTGTDQPASVAWGNLFCMDHAQGSPKRAKAQFGQISELSRLLLRAQIEILRPDLIFFVTGHGYDRQLKACVPIEVGSSKVHTPKKLWQFRVGNAWAFRTSHPQWEKDRKHRDRALALARGAASMVGA